MDASTATALFSPRPREEVIADLVARERRSLEALPEPQLRDMLEDALYSERKRLERKEVDPQWREHLDALARALVRGDRTDLLLAARPLIESWSDEIHGRFDPRMYRFATRLLPRALTGLLSAKPSRLRDWDLSPDRRLKVDGPLELLRDLAAEATLILAPTHVSNLDSPLLGLALYQAGLPPFVYGAGLNLFSNPAMGFFMHRLGAYTVDRTKKARLYKDVLKEYSTRCLTTRHHSLFFPGGTRSRSGVIETHLKKGLLGTGIVAWQEMLEAGRPDPDVYVVPCTLSFMLSLEASSLIDDHLEESGKQRYIITDDEFAQPRRLASFGRRVLELDDAVVVRFGQPLDCAGNPVAADPAERKEQALRRRRYVQDREGRVQWDAQRDRIYTDRLGAELARAYPKLATVMVTHLAAWVAWRALEDQVGTRDPFRIVRMPALARRFPRAAFLERLDRAILAVRRGVQQGAWHVELPPTADAVLQLALDRFGRYHRSRALAAEDGEIVVEDPRLCLYYRNRLAHADLEAT